MRTPMAKGFGSMGTPEASSISKVSRALCPMASTARSQGMTVPSAIFSPVRRPFSVHRPVTCVLNRTSPPREMMRLRRFCTTVSNTSVPT